MDENELKERMIRDNAEFRKLYEEHQRHEQRLDELKGKSFLTEEEKLEEKELKKIKLTLKDQMYKLMRDFQKSL
ncbi:MAG: DUF465 domain-containing protein [Candidatus Aminicenantales bacterium]